MTNSEKRWWKTKGFDWRQVERERSASDVYDVDYSAHLVDGELRLPENMPPEEGLIIHTAAALDVHRNGRFTGRVTCPARVFEKCARDVIRFAMRTPAPTTAQQ